jgi:hypothetical protein
MSTSLSIVSTSLTARHVASQSLSSGPVGPQGSFGQAPQPQSRQPVTASAGPSSGAATAERSFGDDLGEYVKLGVGLGEKDVLNHAIC